ncbi:MAG: hypothetical protein RLZZ214_2525 [Verrucomicrobiota bacterium]|jgi:hypothetical protein
MESTFVIRTCALFAIMAATSSLRAEEGGTGHYVPGGAATLIDLPPTKAGWVVEPIYLHYEGNASASRPIPVGGLLAGGLDAASDAFILGGVYTFDPEIIGAHYSVAAYAPYVWMQVDASIATPLGTIYRSDSEDGFGDMTLVPVMMAWKQDFWQFNAMLPVYAPTGDYETGRLANVGLNRWTFDPTLGASYNNSKSGFNAAIFTGITLNTENNDTNYQSGSVWYLDASVQQLLPVGKGYLGIGANAFVYDQATGDGGSGARLGDFEARTLGVGPTLTYILPSDKTNLVVEARWLPELVTKNRTQGDFLWLKMVYQF